MSTTITRLDPQVIRKDFPILDQEVNGKPLVYLDNAATTQKPEAVLKAIVDYYRRDNANVHRGIHELSRRATTAYEGARERVAKWIGATDTAELVWTRGTTEAINMVANAWGDANVSEGDEILVSVMEHHSNIVPWQLLAGRTGAALRYIEIDDEGRMILDDLANLLSERTRIVAVNHVSNALGTINPVQELAEAAHAVGALLLVDGAQGAAHLPVDVEALGCDFYALSGHKLCGPTGVGALWARKSLLEAMPPYQGGGEMIRDVERDMSTWASLPHKFEAGTPNIAGAIGMATATEYLDRIGRNAILAHERDLMTYALERASEIPEMKIYGPTDLTARSAVLPFTLGKIHPHDVSTILDSQGIAVRAGHHCAQLVMKRYDVTATTRASFYIYNTRDEVDRLFDGLEVVRQVFSAD